MDQFCTVGLGYVGLRVASALAEQKLPVIGYDINQKRILELRDNIDHNLDISTEKLSQLSINYTYESTALANANFYFVDIDTPITDDHQIDISTLLTACKTLGQYIKPNDVIVFESTVYPGATEEVLIPILEEQSQLTHNKDFFVGYSPERIVPGDKTHDLINTTKIIAADNSKARNKIKSIYEKILQAPVYICTSIKVAETTKLLENIQRDVNIALMNEMAMLSEKIGISIKEVIAAAQTKWNFSPYQPGLVGGHCIPVDPYYLMYKGERIGASTTLIKNARLINDSMIVFIEQLISRFNKLSTNILIMGFSFKANIADTRNSLSIKLYESLKVKNPNIQLFDPIAYISPKNQDNIKTKAWENIESQDAIIITVAHDCFKLLGLQSIISKLSDNGLLIDIPGIFKEEVKKPLDINYWSF